MPCKCRALNVHLVDFYKIDLGWSIESNRYWMFSMNCFSLIIICICTYKDYLCVYISFCLTFIQWLHSGILLYVKNCCHCLFNRQYCSVTNNINITLFYQCLSVYLYPKQCNVLITILHKSKWRQNFGTPKN